MIRRPPRSTRTDTLFPYTTLFRSQALMLTVELPEPGDYVARTMLGKPLLVVRGKDGVARIFLNVCRHRGAQLCKEGKGHAPRFACPYHNWTYDREGKLVGISGKDKFGAEVGADLGLRSEERGVGKECVGPCRYRWS